MRPLTPILERMRCRGEACDKTDAVHPILVRLGDIVLRIPVCTKCFADLQAISNSHAEQWVVAAVHINFGDGKIHEKLK